MLDRREFLAKSAVGGLALTGGGLSLATSAVASSRGYAVGQKVASIVGPDQYERRTKLSSYLGRWVLLDVCTTWCVPCIETAASLPAFARSVNEQGVPFSVVTTLLQGPVTGRASTQGDAEVWAAYFGYERNDAVIHCDGEATPLYQLNRRFEEPTGNNEDSFPCYALIDPAGVVRFVGGVELDTILGVLGESAGVELVGSWPLGTANPPFFADMKSVTATFGLLGGGQVSDTLPVGGSGPAFSVSAVNGSNGSSIAALQALNGSVTLHLTEGVSIDPNAPIRITVERDFDRSYRGAIAPLGEGENVIEVTVDGKAGQAPNDIGWYGTRETTEAEKSAWYTNGRDGTTFATVPFTLNELQETPGAGRLNTLTVFFNGFVHALPYHLSKQLAESVSSPGVPLSVQTKVVGLLRKARQNMAQRNFSGAANLATQAAVALEHQGIDPVIQGQADRVAANLAWLVAH
jgi:thiol-disulfide isomerase/thioredoxin